MIIVVPNPVSAIAEKQSFRKRVGRLVEEIFCAKTLDHDVRLPGITVKLKEIPTEQFREIVREFRGSGWQKIKEYNGFDAWIDYGMMVLRRNDELLKCEWTNWEEGTFEGSTATLDAIKARLAAL